MAEYTKEHQLAEDLNFLSVQLITLNLSPEKNAAEISFTLHRMWQIFGQIHRERHGHQIVTHGVVSC